MAQRSSMHVRALDGLRGLAMIFVFLAHTGGRQYGAQLPTLLQPLWNTIMGSGGTGVSLLFILSGFLHGYLYTHVTHYWVFVRRRYFRIFPLFVAIVVGQLTLYIFPQMPRWLNPLILLIPVMIGGLIIRSSRSWQNQQIGRIVFWAFVTVQIITAIWYAFMEAGYLSAPQTQLQRTFGVFMVNITLTRAFGTSIRNLDGVYWTLITEIIFYGLYPIVFLPIVQRITSATSAATRVFTIVITALACYGIHMLLRHLLHFQIINSVYFAFFVWGMLIAHYHRAGWGSVSELVRRVYERVGAWSVVGAFVVLTIVHHAAYHLSEHTALVRLVSGLPLSIVFITILYGKDIINRALQSRILTNIGRVSYGIFLTHTAMIGMVYTYMKPHNIAEYLALISVAFALSYTLSHLAWHALERAYYQPRQT